MRNLLTELKRRNVFKVGVLYLVTGWLLLQAGDVLFALLGLPDWTLKLVLGFLVLGFPVALIFSWIYELTPEGIKREKDVDRSQSITPETGQKINIAIGVGLAVAIGLLVYQQLQLSGQLRSDERDAVASAPGVPPQAASLERAAPTSSAPSIAVLPFVDMSRDADQEYFADGLSDTLMHMLSQVRGLKVAARTSSFTFKGQNKKVREIAEELGVKNVLEGSVQKAGDRVRVIAQLIDASDGTHLWSANFDRDLADIFAIQDEIAQEVVAALKVALLDEDQSRLTERYQPSLEAYEQVILGRQEVEKRTAASLAAAEAHFKKAIELDPNYPLAYVGLADTYNLQSDYADLRIEDEIELMRPLVGKALELDPLSGEAHTSRAAMLLDMGELDEAEKAFQRAIELNPSYARAHHWYSNALRSWKSAYEEALEPARRAAELDPLSPIIRANYAQTLYQLGQVEKAEALTREGIEDHPDFANFYRFLSGLAASSGDLGLARRWHQEVLRINPDGLPPRVQECYWMIEMLEDLAVQDCLERLEAEFSDNIPVIFLRINYESSQGNVDAVLRKASEVLERFAGNPEFARYIGSFKGYLLAGQGDLERALESYRAAFPELLEGKVDSRNFYQAVQLAWVLKQDGQDQLAEALLEGAEGIIAARHRTRGAGYGIQDVYIATLRGHHDLALERLREAVDEGWRQNWRFELTQDYRLEPLREEPRFAAIVDEVRADILAQREWYQAHKDTPLAQL